MMYTMKVVDACRSLRASYNIAHKTETHFFVKVTGPGEPFIREQADDIKTLGKASIVDINETESVIVGTVVVDDSLTVLMDVKGLVDYEVEIARLQKSLKSTVPAIETLERKMAADGYAEKVPKDLQEANQQKLESLNGKKSEVETAIASLEKIQLLDKK